MEWLEDFIRDRGHYIWLMNGMILGLASMRIYTQWILMKEKETYIIFWYLLIREQWMTTIYYDQRIEEYLASQRRGALFGMLMTPMDFIAARERSNLMKQDREYFGALLDLWAWQKNPKGSYKELLFDLMEKANHWDQAKLARIYPTEFAAYTAWRYSPDGEKFLNDILPEQTNDK